MNNGKLFVVGIGPNGTNGMTFSAISAIDEADCVVGYDKYLKRIASLLEHKETISTGMRRETERVSAAISLVGMGKTVALISSGDSGVYGMASLAIEMGNGIDLEIIPGVTAAISAGALLGAPLTLDFAVLSLSDIMIPWEKIVRRAECFAQSGVTTVFYNPVSSKRKWQFKKILDIFSTIRKDFIVGVVKNAFMEEEEKCFFKLSQASDNWHESLNMMSIVFFCDEECICKEGRIYTPRGYKV